MFWIVIPGIFIIFMTILTTYAYGAYKGAPWVPMRARDLSRIQRLIPLTSADTVYDLGSGDGRLLFHAAHYGAKAVGYEISLLPYIIAKFRSRKYPRKSVQTLFQDFWKHDLSEASVVFIFLTPPVHARIGEKLKRELKPGSRVVSYVWPIAGLTLRVKDKTSKNLSLFVYDL